MLPAMDEFCEKTNRIAHTFRNGVDIINECVKPDMIHLFLYRFTPLGNAIHSLEEDVARLKDGSVHTCGEEPCEETRSRIKADMQSVVKPTTTDASTDMSLTPHWWGPTVGMKDQVAMNQGADVAVSGSSTRPSYATAASSKRNKSRGRATKVPAGDEPIISEPVPPATLRPPKPPAVLIHFRGGRSFADTVGSIKSAP